MQKIFIITFSAKKILRLNFLKVLYFKRKISWEKLIFRSRITCKQKDVDSSKWREQRVKLLAIFHIKWIFVKLNFRWKNFGMFASDENISTRKIANYGSTYVLRWITVYNGNSRITTIHKKDLLSFIFLVWSFQELITYLECISCGKVLKLTSTSFPFWCHCCMHPRSADFIYTLHFCEIKRMASVGAPPR